MVERLRYIQTIRKVGEELEQYTDQDHRRIPVFGPVSRVNILVGPTNSGKSRFMRGLIKTTEDKIISIEHGAPDPNQSINACWRLGRANLNMQITINPNSLEYDPNKNIIESPWLSDQLSSLNPTDQRTFDLTRGDFSKLHSWIQSDLADPASGTAKNDRRLQMTQLMQMSRFLLHSPDLSDSEERWVRVSGMDLHEDNKKDIELVADFIEALCSSDQSSVNPPKVYIPVLRTAVRLKEIGSSDTIDYLAQSIRENYGFGTNDVKAEVFSGNLLYWIIQEERSGDPKIHQRLNDFERFLGRTFFEGKSVFLKPLSERYDSGRHLAVLIDEQIQRRFHDLGDGIQAIIILMYRLFTAESGTWIFIEEPEQGLHPGLQRIFLETLANHPVIREKDLRIFLSTHSSHLLGMAISELEDVSVFSFQSWIDSDYNEWFEVRPVHTRQQNLLSLLGVANSSVFLANCSIWVEGITDRLYLRAYLSAYLQSDDFDQSFIPQEDIHYAFLEYGGSNLAHYIFETDEKDVNEYVDEIRAQFLCNRIFLLADKDENKEGKHEALKASQSESFEYYFTPGIEIENLVSESEFSQALPGLIRGLTEKEVSDAKISFSDYRDKRIGSYLVERFDDYCPAGLKAKNGSLSAYYKSKLVGLVCANVTWENMSKDARDLSKAIYRFILKHNKVVPKAQ